MKVAAGDYPCWVYDPTGVNPPMFVQGDPQFVALLNAPLPSTAVPGLPPTVVATASGSVSQAAPALTSVGGTTQIPPGARFTKSPTVGAPVASVFVNKTPHVVGKR